MTEIEFRQAAEAVFGQIEQLLDAADVDYTPSEAVLEIDCENSTLVLTAHRPNRELWLAAPQGGFHFRPMDGKWLDTRSGAEFFAEFARLMHANGVTISG
jgi:CyaY protein